MRGRQLQRKCTHGCTAGAYTAACAAGGEQRQRLTAAAARCLLSVPCLAIPQGMTAADFKRLSEKKEHQPPAPGQRGAAAGADELRERAFWSSVTNSPPLYGADTPVSLFDQRVSWGWNLRKLGCMLQSKEFDVPDIPGASWAAVRACAAGRGGVAAGPGAAQRGGAAGAPVRLRGVVVTAPCPATRAGVTSPMCYFGMWKSFFGW